ncbi:hypothetical protein [Geminisphaera colitermitum]|uniref:hypothetical protein n=1 Tax=Geminisphaera colitermitum TaxID=1148786 RepID=UPI000158D0ED|nr:hypothetical protein [Geminisphaera colitermitum]
MNDKTNTERLNAPYYFVFPNLPRDVWYGSPDAPDSALLVGCVWSEGPDSATKLAEALNCQATKDVCWLDWKRRAEAAEALVAELREALEPFAREANTWSGEASPKASIVIAEYGFSPEEAEFILGDLMRAADVFAKTPAEMGADYVNLRDEWGAMVNIIDRHGAFGGEGAIDALKRIYEEWASLRAHVAALAAAGDALASDLKFVCNVMRHEGAIVTIGNESLAAWDAAKKGGL